MNDDEKALLLAVARWIAEREEADAAKLGTTSNLASEMRPLIERVSRSYGFR